MKSPNSQSAVLHSWLVSVSCYLKFLILTFVWVSKDTLPKAIIWIHGSLKTALPPSSHHTSHRLTVRFKVPTSPTKCVISQRVYSHASSFVRLYLGIETIISTVFVQRRSAALDVNGLLVFSQAINWLLASNFDAFPGDRFCYDVRKQLSASDAPSVTPQC